MERLHGRADGRGEAKPWLRTVTTATGPALSWREVDSQGREVRYAPLTLGWYVGKGWYRVHLYFYWAYDGTKYYDDTSDWCQVT